jgi:hypothetical protein
METIEISSLDLSYENCRMRSADTEKRLLSSILENGIREPLQGVNANGKQILLDGFKRFRCARQLKLSLIPYSSICNDEAHGIIELLRISNVKSLSILEQAKLIDQLMTVQRLTLSEISFRLEKSKAWVSVRAGIIREMSDFVMEQILMGKFPAYVYMYTLRPFIRINKIAKSEIDEFVGLVAGKKLSIRDIERLVNGYFHGSDAFRAQIKTGNILWGLKCLKESFVKPANCSEFEQRTIRDLENLQKYMDQIAHKIKDTRLKSGSFYALANLILEGILKNSNKFNSEMKDFYDKTRQT